MFSDDNNFEIEPHPAFLMNPRVPLRPKRHKANRSRRMKKKFRINESTAVNNYFPVTRPSDTFEDVPSAPTFDQNPTSESNSSVQNPTSESNSSVTKRLLKKSDLNYNSLFLEFRDSKLDLLFQKYLCCYHSFYTVLSWVVFPYCLLNISIFSVNLGTFFKMNTLAIVICSLLQVLNLILLAAYFYNLYSIRSELKKKTISAHLADELNRIEIASSPHFQHSLFQEISKYDDQLALPDEKAVILGRLAAALAAATLMMIAAWSILMSAYGQCPGFCVNNVPTFGVFFLWIIPFHFSVFTSIRAVPVFLLEIISKFLAYLAFSIQSNAVDSANYIVYVVVTILLWVGFWLPLLYSWNHRQLLHFHDIEAFRRVIAHYKSNTKPIAPSFDIFDNVELRGTVNNDSSTEIRVPDRTEEEISVHHEENLRIQVNALEMDDEEYFV